MIASATQVKVNGIRGYIRLFLWLRKIKEQISNTPGLISVHFRGLRTLTLWENIEAMHSFRNSGAHMDAMKNARLIGKSRSFTWEVSELPHWKEAIAKLNSKDY